MTDNGFSIIMLNSPANIINLMTKRAISLQTCPLLINNRQSGTNASRCIQIEIKSNAPLNKKQQNLLSEYFEIHPKVQGGDRQFSFVVNPHLGPNEFELRINGKKIVDVPHLFEMTCGKYIDTRYKSPPGKPKGAESRFLSVAVSPVYDGVARKLGYKPINGYQHP